MAANYFRPGLGNVGSYQSSGIPFLSSSIVVPAVAGTPIEIQFPYITRTLVVRNDDGGAMRVGFSANGVSATENNYYFTLVKDASLEMDFKVKSLFLISETAGVGSATVIAGLTSISTEELQLNWSGSRGVG